MRIAAKTAFFGVVCNLRLRRIAHRHELFSLVIEVPGLIPERGKKGRVLNTLTFVHAVELLRRSYDPPGG